MFFRLVSKGARTIHLFTHFCYRIYHLATVHSITDRRHYQIILHAVQLAKNESKTI